MFAYISGKLDLKLPAFAVVDVNGVGFKIAISLSTYSRLPDAGKPVKLFIHTHLRQDDISLYGFYAQEEKEAFEILLSVSGIGPKVALCVLSELSVGELKSAVIKDNTSVLTAISGIGKKTASRIVLELSEKMDDFSAQEVAGDSRKQVTNDAVSALVSLGYSRKASRDSVDRAIDALSDEFSLEDLIRQALKILR